MAIIIIQAFTESLWEPLQDVSQVPTPKISDKTLQVPSQEFLQVAIK